MQQEHHHLQQVQLIVFHFTSGYAASELDHDSGDVVYIENRAPITRASDQTENVKLVIEF